MIEKNSRTELRGFPYGMRSFDANIFHCYSFFAYTYLLLSKKVRKLVAPSSKAELAFYHAFFYYLI